MLVKVFTGSRNLRPSDHWLRVVLRDADAVIVGDCPTGVDRAVYDRAVRLGVEVIEVRSKTQDAAGKRARNIEIAEMAERAARGAENTVEAYALPCVESRGTWHCYRELKKRGIYAKIFRLGKWPRLGSRKFKTKKT